MSLEERLEKAEKLVAEVKAELAAMRVTKRNWPERIEAGDCFEVTSGARWMKTDTDGILVCIRDEHGKMDAAGVTIKVTHYDDMTYLGHARDILTIRTDAHEPTGAELVGKVCEPTGADLVGKRCRVSLAQIHHSLDGVEATVIHYKKGFGYATEEGEGQRWTFARLAK